MSLYNEIEGKIVSFKQAGDADIIYYAGLTWKESAENAERMRKMIWHKEYEEKPDRSLSKRKLKGSQDDFE